MKQVGNIIIDSSIVFIFFGLLFIMLGSAIGLYRWRDGVSETNVMNEEYWSVQESRRFREGVVIVVGVGILSLLGGGAAGAVFGGILDSPGHGGAVDWGNIGNTQEAIGAFFKKLRSAPQAITLVLLFMLVFEFLAIICLAWLYRLQRKHVDISEIYWSVQSGEISLEDMGEVYKNKLHSKLNHKYKSRGGVRSCENFLENNPSRKEYTWRPIPRSAALVAVWAIWSGLIFFALVIRQENVFIIKYLIFIAIILVIIMLIVVVWAFNRSMKYRKLHNRAVNLGEQFRYIMNSLAPVQERKRKKGRSVRQRH